MPQSLASIPVHCIWSTKDRQPFISQEIEKALFSYMASIFRAYESPALTIKMGLKIMCTVLQYYREKLL